MITGYNTDVKRQDTVYHVQTEDKGIDNPLIESLIYAGGKIVASRQYFYGWMLREGYNEKAVQELLDRQHRKMLRDVQGGKFDPEGPPPFGAGIISDRSLDAVVLEFLRGETAPGGLEIVIKDKVEARAGDLLVLELSVRSDAGGAAVPAARLLIRASAPHDGGEARTIVLFQGMTDRQGAARAGVEVPRDFAGGTLAIEADAPQGHAEAVFQVAVP
ncbi:MAG TPA: hypothetical protein VJV23_13990 [Candidatus Polarisedimenticolia bacterium]|nr:hypothetical protein [Candidatus Polarisedimenticolia bacterium]